MHHCKGVTRLRGRKAVLTAATVIVMTASTGTRAADQADEVIEEIRVTGSRVVRDGASAPTPVTVVGSELLEKRGSVNIADTLNEMPAFRGSTTPQSTTTLIRATGMNFVNLRNLGTNRTLVLVDDIRHVPSSDTGQVDLNLIPSLLIERAEVVTGGASAVYGSDAVAGVVNLILKRNVEGVRADVQFGQAEVGDNTEYRASILAGTSFADGRGRVAIAADWLRNDGVEDPYSRDWGRKEYGLVVNPTPGQTPVRVIAPNVHQSTMTFAGIITGGPLRGTQFNPDGTVGAPYVYGDLAGSQLMIGGSGTGQRFFDGVGLLPELERKVVYVRSGYELNDDTEVFLDISNGWSRGIGYTPYPFDFGNNTISIGNPFLPQQVRDQMTDLGLQSFAFGRFWNDFGNAHGDSINETWRAVTGIRGKLGDGWRWDANVQYGKNDNDQRITNAFILSRKNQALDAVVGPNGQIMCASTVTNPNNGCVPFNPFGIGRASPEAYEYLRATQQLLQNNRQTSAALNIAGEPFELWAGPLSLATGVEYREETVHATADPLGQVDAFGFGNYKPLDGSYDAKEAYLEVETPLLKDKPLVDSLNLNGAVRYTDYSTSGGVTTWKVGLTWDLSPELRLRTTRSRDIRAPNMAELFTPPRTNSPALLVDPTRNNATAFATSKSPGNPDLVPEEADTFTVGFVYEPRWAGGLRAAVDYYDIDLKDAISTLQAQQIVDRCFRGEAALCPLITRDGAGVITQVDSAFINIASAVTKGLDFEVSYDTQGLGGEWFTRLLATRVLDDYQSNGAVVTDIRGQNNAGSPDWVATLDLGYDRGRFSTMVQGRWFSSGTFSNLFVEGIDINDNSLPSMLYTNLSLQYDFGPSGEESRYQLFSVVNNLFDRDPPPQPTQIMPTGGIYDVIGRTYRIGARIRF